MTDRRTIRLVIMLIGITTLGALFGTYMLAQRVMDQAAGTKTPDAAVIGLVGITGAIVTGGLGYLGGMLASTRSTPDKAEIDAALAPLANAPLIPPAILATAPGSPGGPPLKVEGVPDGEPVATTDAEPEPPPEPPAPALFRRR